MIYYMYVFLNSEIHLLYFKLNKNEERARPWKILIPFFLTQLWKIFFKKKWIREGLLRTTCRWMKCWITISERSNINWLKMNAVYFHWEKPDKWSERGSRTPQYQGRVTCLTESCSGHLAVLRKSEQTFLFLISRPWPASKLHSVY
jgi:hypothetical protein